MAVETELKLALSPAAWRLVGQHPCLANLPMQSRRLYNTYFDTPDRLLAANGLALRFRKQGRQWRLTVKSSDERGTALTQRLEWEFPAEYGQFDFSPIDCARVRRKLEKALPVLQPVFTTHFLRRTWLVHSESICIEVALDRGRIVSGARSLPISEIELELRTGTVADLFALARALQATLPLSPALASKAERGYLLLEGGEERPCKAIRVALAATMTPRAAGRELALAALRQWQKNVESQQGWHSDVEFLHQGRVALRRLRSVSSLFAPVLPDFLSAGGQEWPSFAAEVGRVRNWDVFLTQTLPAVEGIFPHSPDLVFCRQRAQVAAQRASRELAAALNSPHYARWLFEISAALAVFDDEPAEISLRSFACRRLRQLARRARRRVPVDEGTGTLEEWHRLRLALKRLRYGLEFMAPLLPAKRLKPYQKYLECCLEGLGRLSDLDTARNLVRSWQAERRTLLLQGWLAGQSQALLPQIRRTVGNWLEATPPWQD